MRKLRFIGIVAVLSLVAVGCASGPTYRSALNDLTAEQRATAKPYLEQYQSTPAEIESFYDNAEAVAEVMDALPPEWRERFRHDPMLDLIAYEQAVMGAASDYAMPHGLRVWIAWKYGRIGLGRWRTYNWALRGDMKGRLQKKVAATLERLIAAAEEDDYGYYTFGIVRTTHQMNRYAQSLIVLGHRVEFEPVPKFMEPGQCFMVKGRVLNGTEKCRVYWSDEQGNDGKKSCKKTIGDDRVFKARLNAPEKPGRYMLKVACKEDRPKPEGKDDRWLRDALLVPVYVYEKEEQVPSAQVVKPPPDPKYLRDWPLAILNSYNAERLRRGLDPLRLDANASRMALAHVKAENEDPTTGVNTSVEDDLNALGYNLKDVDQYSRVLDNIAEQVWEGLQDPHFYRDLMNPNTHRIGLGLTRKACKEEGKCSSDDFRMAIYFLEDATGETSATAQNDAGEATNDQTVSPAPTEGAKDE